MGEIIYYVAASLDGYIAPPDGKVDWLAPFDSESEDYGFSEFLASVDAILFGSRTYEQSLTFGDWPYEGKKCWVFSRRNLPPERNDVIITDRGPSEVAAELDARGIKRTWLIGGGALAASFRNAGLITEYIVSYIPIVLGAGVPLFAAPGPRESLQLVSQSAYSNGIVQLRYVVRQ